VEGGRRKKKGEKKGRRKVQEMGEGDKEKKEGLRRSIGGAG